MVFSHPSQKQKPRLTLVWMKRSNFFKSIGRHLKWSSQCLLVMHGLLRRVVLQDRNHNQCFNILISTRLFNARSSCVISFRNGCVPPKAFVFMRLFVTPFLTKYFFTATTLRSERLKLAFGFPWL